MSNFLQIKITNIHPSTTEEELEGLFAEFGEVDEIYLNEEPEPGKRTYAAIITMGSEDEAREAFGELKGEWVDGNQLGLAWYTNEEEGTESPSDSEGEENSDDEDENLISWDEPENEWADLEDKNWDKPEEPRKMR